MHSLQKILGAAILATGAATAQEFQADTFSLWALYPHFGCHGSGGEIVHDGYLGNPGACMVLGTRPDAAFCSPAGTASAVRLAMISPTARWEPRVDGPLKTLRMAMDVRTLRADANAPGHFFGIAVLQDGIVYAAPALGTPGSLTGLDPNWRRLGDAVADQSTFTAIFPDGATGQPDFSAQGNALQFGFVASDDITTGTREIVQVYDNWRLEVTPRGGFEERGTGCVGTYGEPRIDTRGRPWIGNASFALRCTRIPSGATAIAVLGASDQHWSAANVALPHDLSPLGMTSCWLRVSGEIVSAPRQANGVGAALSMPIPGDPSLAGVEIHAQWWVGDPGANPMGAVLSQSAALRIE